MRPPIPSGREAASAFTLVEVLCGTAILGVLVALLLPTLGKMKDRSTKTQCAANLRQIMGATALYAAENDSQFPVLGWTGGNSPHRVQRDVFEEKFQSYLGPRDKIMFCPGPLKRVRNPGSSQAYKDNFVTYQYALMPLWNQANAPKRSASTSPREPLWSCLTYMSGAVAYGHSNPATTTPVEGMNVACADGSVQWVNAQNLKIWGQDGAAQFLWPRPETAP